MTVLDIVVFAILFVWVLIACIACMRWSKDSIRMHYRDDDDDR